MGLLTFPDESPSVRDQARSSRQLFESYVRGEEVDGKQVTPDTFLGPAEEAIQRAKTLALTFPFETLVMYEVVTGTLESALRRVEDLAHAASEFPQWQSDYIDGLRSQVREAFEEVTASRQTDLTYLD
jgi:hypothetical protein